MAFPEARAGVLDATTCILRSVAKLQDFVILPHHAGETAEEQDAARKECLEFLKGYVADAERFNALIGSG